MNTSANVGHDGIVIIGAGECGVRAAFALREKGYQGPLTVIGDEPHLPYEKPPLTKGCAVVPKYIATKEAYAAASIDLWCGTSVTGIDAKEKTVRIVDGRTLGFDRLLIATGARPRPIPGMDSALTLRSFDDARDIISRISSNTRLIIIGGGFIGLELAAIARKSSASVFVVEAADRLMGRVVPTEIAAVFEERHRSEGVEILLNAKPRSITRHAVALHCGREIECDLVVAGVGAVPNTELAEAASLEVDNGVVVDATLQTSVADIYAAGDCCSFPYRGRRVRLESWRAAQEQGNHAARSMLGGGETYTREPWFWSDQYDLTLQIVGLPDPEQYYHRRDLAGAAFVLFQVDDRGKLISASGVGFGSAVAKDIRLAELIMERGIAPDVARLVDPSVNLKALLDD